MPENTNPLLARIKFPGETFQIPSRGILYTEGELSSDVENGEIRIFPMTTLDEVTMKSPDMLFSGDAIREVFSRCIPQVQDVDRMFAKDIDFLLICLRKVSYGDIVRIDYNHSCQKDEEGNVTSKDLSYELSIQTILQNSKQIDPTKKMKKKLKNGQIVTIQPIKFGDFVKLSQQSVEAREKVMSRDELNKNVLFITSSLIHDVDGITERDLILEWLHSIPSSWVRDITQAIDSAADWGPSYGVKAKCRECENEMTIEVPLNPIHFFT